MQIKICRTIYARSLHKYANEKYTIYVPTAQNMHKYTLYADICVICLNVHEGKYAIICSFNLII